jgi:hypothetical protein
LQPQRDGRVRCSAWLGGVVISTHRLWLQTGRCCVCLLACHDRLVIDQVKAAWPAKIAVTIASRREEQPLKPCPLVQVLVHKGKAAEFAGRDERQAARLGGEAMLKWTVTLRAFFDLVFHNGVMCSRLTTKAQRRRPRGAPIATAMARRRSLQRMVRPRHRLVLLTLCADSSRCNIFVTRPRATTRAPSRT